MDIIAREVVFSPGGPVQTYHAVGQQDYVAIVARTPDGRIPIVRQYRPALETFTWELPAGLVEHDEDPAESCRRELLEETGYPADAIQCAWLGGCLQRAAEQPHPFVLCRDWRSNFQFYSGAGNLRGDKDAFGARVRSSMQVNSSSNCILGRCCLAELRGLMQLPR